MRQEHLRAFLRLVRFPNLVIVALTQYLVYFALFKDAFDEEGIRMALQPGAMHLFVADTLLITAGGYIINDIFDFRSDMANRPGRMALGRYIHKQTAYWLYYSLSLIGFFLALILAFQVGRPPLVALYPLAVLFLFLYTAYFKKAPLAGNLLIAAFCAGVAGVIWFAEREGFSRLIVLSPKTALELSNLLNWYLAFAFLSTLYRELVKDLEDMPGDARAGCRTVPLAWGVGTAKIMAGLTAVLLLLLLLAMALAESERFGAISYGFTLAGLMLPVGYSLAKLKNASGSKDYRTLSQLAKLIMLNGLLLLLLLTFQ
ncbi:geranylgeranylglycerol-phosphate geranylgeranyltransferase [Phaeodactylibacter luteus]|nr:geranylgeranylglycerol-phosphate geranylgeranyltransferase [Phaeodactylibacter luteus]